jgi:hypothetical protein
MVPRHRAAMRRKAKPALKARAKVAVKAAASKAVAASHAAMHALTTVAKAATAHATTVRALKAVAPMPTGVVDKTVKAVMTVAAKTAMNCHATLTR